MIGAVELAAPLREGECMAEDGLVPSHGPVDGTRVRIEQELVRVAAEAVRRGPRDRGRGSRSAGPGRHQTGSRASCSRSSREGRPGVSAADGVEEAKLDALGDAREDAEVRALAVERGTQRVGVTGPGGWACLRGSESIVWFPCQAADDGPRPGSGHVARSTETVASAGLAGGASVPGTHACARRSLAIAIRH